ncbi:hypothetical protein [Maribacter sp. 2304DJ31-5]|uniref:hypothetical protein n=1 Tax=Maribacter sp. 2304DJ31-5 TaxID=3386273 RepID=UPI0039BCA4B5
MNKRILLLTLIGISFGINAQNTFPTTGKVGIGTSTPQYTIDIDGNFQRGSGIKHIMRLTHKNALDSGDGTSLLFTNRGHSANDYGGYIALVSSGSNPGWLNPRLDFAVQNPNTHQLNDISTKMTILGNGNIGIGTTSPSSGIEIFKGNTNNLALLLKSSGAGWGSGLQLHNTSGNRYGIYSGSDGKWHFSHEGQGDRLVIDSSGNIGIGTANPNDWKLAVNGKIRAKEIKVETGWSDFVFYDNYKLPTLQEVENHIKEKGHLKDIPSAKEVQEKGIYLGEMDSKLLQKIEELTLYTIQQEKKIKEQAKKIEDLESINKKLIELQKRLEKLENSK